MAGRPRISVPRVLSKRPSVEECPDAADRTGWHELVADVSAAYESLPAAERDGAVVLCRSYGCAGAIELLGPAAGLPRAISGHKSYWMWGPGEPAPQVVIAIGIDEETLDQVFSSHELAGVYRCEYCMVPRSVESGRRRPLRRGSSKAECEPFAAMILLR
jgi:hypothetical protein